MSFQEFFSSIQLVYDLSCQLQKTSCDLQCAQHRLTEAEKEKVQLKSEIHAAEGLLLRQDTFRKGPGEMDPEKLMERIKKLNVQIDLTNQRCQNYEAKIKTMEVAAQKFEAVQMERNSIQFQLREAQQQFRQAREEMVRIQQACSNSYNETAQMGLHIANLENKLQGLTRQKEALQMELDTEKKEKLEAITCLEKLKLDECQREKEVSEVKEQLALLTSRKEAMQCDLDGRDKERIAVVTELEKITKEFRQKETELLAIREQLSLVTVQKDALQSQLETQDEVQSSRTTELETIYAQLQEKNEELCSVKQQLSTLQKVMEKEADKDLRKKTSQPDEVVEHRIESVRKEEATRWTAVLEAKVEEVKKDAEEKRRDEILNIQRQTMEKLQEISDDMDAKKRQKVDDLQKPHTKELSELEQRLSEELRMLEEKYREDVASMRTENEKLTLATKDHGEDVEELRHRFEQDLKEKESELSEMEVILTKKEIKIGELEEQLKQLGQEMERSRQQSYQPNSNDEICTALQRQLNSLKAEHENQMAMKGRELEAALADQVECLQRRHEEQLEKLSTEHQSQLKECELRHNAAINEAVKKSELESENRVRDLEEFYSEDLREAKVSLTMLEKDSQKLGRCEQQLAEKTTRVLQLQETLTLMEQKHKETCETVVRLEAECCETVGEKERRISELTDANSKLEKSVGCFKEQVELLEQELTSGEVEYKCSVAKVEKQVSGVQQLLKERDNRVCTLEMDVERLQRRLSAVNDQLHEKVDALRKNTDKQTLQSAEIAKLKQCVNEMRLEASNNQSLAVECENLRTKKWELSGQVKLFEERESQLKVKLMAAEEEVAKFLDEKNLLNQQLTEAEQKKKELELIVETLKAESKKDKAEIVDLEKYSDEVVEELRKVQNYICDEQEKQRMEKQRLAAEADAQRLRKERNELREKVKSLECQLSGANVECGTSRQEHERSKQKLRDEIDRLQKDRDVSVEKELEEKRIKVGRLKLKVNELETNFVSVTDALKAKLKSQALEIMRLEGETKKFKEEVKKLGTTLSERPAVAAVGTVAGKPNEVERMSVGTVSGGGMISDFNYYMTKAENETMKRKNSDLHSELASLKSRHEQWKKENSDLHQLVVEQDKKIAKYREQFACTPGGGDVQRTAIAPVNSPDVADGQTGSPGIDIQKWVHGDTNPYDSSMLVKTLDAEDCKTQ